jgi:hypothetical protein
MDRLIDRLDFDEFGLVSHKAASLLRGDRDGPNAHVPRAGPLYKQVGEQERHGCPEILPPRLERPFFPFPEKVAATPILPLSLKLHVPFPLLACRTSTESNSATCGRNEG